MQISDEISRKIFGLKMDVPGSNEVNELYG